MVLPDHPRPGIVAYDDDLDEFAEAIGAADAYLAVARGYIDRPLLGALLAATDLLSRSHPDHGLLRQAAVVMLLFGSGLVGTAEGTMLLFGSGLVGTAEGMVLLFGGQGSRNVLR
jgi:hypothetical protein